MKRLKSRYNINVKSIFLLIGGILVLTSCEYSYMYSYKITNNSDSNVDVHLKTFRIDSTYKIQKDSTKTLFTTTHGIEASGGPYFDDVKNDIVEFKVIKNKQKVSNRDFLKNDNWSYDKGIYSIIITESDFEK